MGFDRIFDLLDSVASQSGKTGDDSWRIVMPVAGFTEAELNLTRKEDELLVTGKTQPRDDRTEYLYRGIAGRDFERHFKLADHVKVLGAKLTNGLLSIDLHRELPEEKKPRATRIDLQHSPRTITQQ